MPIEFKITNANNISDYFDGLSPNCYANDDITHNFGDKNEAMLKEAIYLIQNNQCLNASYKRVGSAFKEPKLKGANLLKGGAI